MADFNPDAYLAEKDKEKAFDPDAYLKQSEPKSNREDWFQKSIVENPITKTLTAAGMGAGHTVSNLVGGGIDLVGKGVGAVSPSTGKAIQDFAARNNQFSDEWNSEYQKQSPIPNYIGQAAGYMVPFAPAAKAVNAVVPAATSLGRVGQAAIAGGAIGAVGTPGGVGERAKEAGIQGSMAAGGQLLLPWLGGVVKGAYNKFNNIDPARMYNMSSGLPDSGFPVSSGANPQNVPMPPEVAQAYPKTPSVPLPGTAGEQTGARLYDYATSLRPWADLIAGPHVSGITGPVGHLVGEIPALKNVPGFNSESLPQIGIKAVKEGLQSQKLQGMMPRAAGPVSPGLPPAQQSQQEAANMVNKSGPNAGPPNPPGTTIAPVPGISPEQQARWNQTPGYAAPAGEPPVPGNVAPESLPPPPPAPPPPPEPVVMPPPEVAPVNEPVKQAKEQLLSTDPTLERYTQDYVVPEHVEPGINDFVNGTAKNTLAYGPPGTGKTSLAGEWINKNADGRIETVHSKSTLQDVKAINDRLNTNGKTLVLVDEIDKLAQTNPKAAKYISDTLGNHPTSQILYTTNDVSKVPEAIRNTTTQLNLDPKLTLQQKQAYGLSIAEKYGTNKTPEEIQKIAKDSANFRDIKRQVTEGIQLKQESPFSNPYSLDNVNLPDPVKTTIDNTLNNRSSKNLVIFDKSVYDINPNFSNELDKLMPTTSMEQLHHVTRNLTSGNIMSPSFRLKIQDTGDANNISSLKGLMERSNESRHPTNLVIEDKFGKLDPAIYSRANIITAEDLGLVVPKAAKSKTPKAPKNVSQMLTDDQARTFNGIKSAGESEFEQKIASIPQVHRDVIEQGLRKLNNPNDPLIKHHLDILEKYRIK